MAKFDSSVLNLGKRVTTSYTYPSPIQGAPNIVLHIRPLNDVEDGCIVGIARPIVARYVTGGWTDEDGKFHDEPDKIFMGDGQQLKIPKADPVYIAAQVEIMQDPPSEDDRYTALDILKFMGSEDMEDIWDKMQKDIVPHMNGKGWAKKDLALITRPSSSEPSSTE